MQSISIALSALMSRE